MRHGKNLGGLAGQKNPVGTHLVGLGVHFDMRCSGVEFQILLADLTCIAHGQRLFRQTEFFANPGILRRGGNECHRAVFDGPAIGAPHLPGIDRLRRRNGGIGIAHLGTDDGAAHQDHFRFHTKEGRRPEHEIGALAFLDAADLVRDAMRDCGIDRVFRHVAAHPHVVVVTGFFG